jgi:hypothetical protein
MAVAVIGTTSAPSAVADDRQHGVRERRTLQHQRQRRRAIGNRQRVARAPCIDQAAHDEAANGRDHTSRRNGAAKASKCSPSEANSARFQIITLQPEWKPSPR